MLEGILNMCTDHKCLIACKKQHRQNEPGGQEDITIGVEICVMLDLRHV